MSVWNFWGSRHALGNPNSFLSGKNDESSDDDDTLHRRRLAQILRYIASMHHSLPSGTGSSSNGEGPSFVQEYQQFHTSINNSSQTPQDFFVGHAQADPWILCTTNHFRHVLAAEQGYASSASSGNSSSNNNNNNNNAPLFKSPPFSFYAVSGAEDNSMMNNRKRKATLFQKGASLASSQSASSHSSSSSSSCWVRLTRLGRESPPELLHHPAVQDYLQHWLSQPKGQNVTSMQDLLTLERLQHAPKVPPGTPLRHQQVIQQWLRLHRKHLRRQVVRQILEPIYQHLFEFTSATAPAADEELVFGLGHARWDKPPSPDGDAAGVYMSCPVLEVLVEVEVARPDGALLIRPRDFTGVSLHRPFLRAANMDPTVAASLHRAVSDVEPHSLCPGQPNTYVPLLQQIALQVAADARFVPSSHQAASDTATPGLVLTEAWCLFRRPKPSSVWARDATAFADAVLQTNANSNNSNSPANLPLATWALTFGPQRVEEKRREALGLAPLSSSDTKGGMTNRLVSLFASKTPIHATPDALVRPLKPLFPLPTSVPQRRIAQLLLDEHYPAVVCEGPPGSGKSHTICNIVCAYLCQGKRVLVTSKNAHALAVLRERLPVTVRDLCVDVSMSELAGMRQLQQTVERLANRISMTSAALETQKCEFLRQKIAELEADTESIDQRIATSSESLRELLLQPDGQRFSQLSLELIETVPWLMRTIATWTLEQIQSLQSMVRNLALEEENPIHRVAGFDKPPSDALVALAAAKAGETLSIISTTAKSLAASVLMVGRISAFKRQQEQTEAALQNITFGGASSHPVSPSDWNIVVQALRHAQAFDKFEKNVWAPQEYQHAWPRFHTISSMSALRDFADKLDKAVEAKTLALALNVEQEMETAAECRSLDMKRSIFVAHRQKIAQELVDATVLVELSKSFSAEAQSALIRFAQIAGRARFSRSSSSQSSRMSQRQRRRRQEYLAAFDQCCRFIPCWILTTSQISDYLPAEGLFDLVIVDEASQSDVTALPGMLRGKQWLIVGDSKQVSPTESFISEDQIYGLQAALPPSPLRDSLLPGHSFFDLCSQAFPGGRVVLCEHFRCSEEIIKFSDEHFYDGQLVPLRLPTKSERLSPSLVDVKVNGVKQGKINAVEVEKIVELIQGIVEDGQKTGFPRSIGVISLIGDDQSRAIRSRLLDAIGPHAMSRHNILIGDPPSFQGAERDIIFLSVIASPGSVPTQNQLMHFQRLNVAMSRARDRCYLIRSIETHHIPNAEDSKLLLLSFFQPTGDKEADESDTSFLGEVSRNMYDKMLARLLEKRGYKVRSMGKVWSHGLCVESVESDARAAVLVDCVGEPIHLWSHSYNQQRAIERVGWKCLRVDAVSLVTDFHGSLQNIVSFLSKCGVEEPKKLYDCLEEDVADDRSVNPDEPLDEIPMDEEPEAAEIAARNENDQNGGVDEQPRNPEEEEVFVISSDDEGGRNDCTGERKDSRPFPDTVPSGIPEAAKEEPPDKFGQVVDLNFLREGQLGTDIEDFAARAHARAKEPSSREGDYEADESEVGDAFQTKRRKRNPKLDKYARDPRWRPGVDSKTREEDETVLYDTDSDLMDDNEATAEGDHAKKIRFGRMDNL